MENTIVLLSKKLPYFKGNMHCHSTLSDGQMTPEELKEWFKGHGYHFLAITDHERAYKHPELDDEDFITITSSELAIKEFPEQSTLVNHDMKVCHLNVYAKEQDNDATIFYNSVLDHYSSDEDRVRLSRELGEHDRVYGADGINAIIREANERGFFVAYNHPRWSLENYGDYGDYEGLWGVEVYNHACARGGLYEYDINVVDDFLRDDKHVWVTCGDDNHSLATCGGAFVMVNVPTLSYKSIIDGLLEGKFYSSFGPTIEELTVTGNRVRIACSDAKQICYSAHGRRVKSIHAPEDGYVNEAEFEILPTDGYFRLDVVDERGGRANTQAYYVKDFGL